MTMHNDVIVRELKSYKEITETFSLIFQLNPDIDKKSFRSRLKKMLNDGYRCIGAFSVKDNSLIGCAGFWIGTRFWCGSFIEPDNVVVERTYRRAGVGDMLMEWIEREGKKRKCRIIKLETYATNIAARSFYARRAYEEPGIVIVKPIGLSAEEWREQLKAKAK